MFTWVVKDAPNNGCNELDRDKGQCEKYLWPGGEIIEKGIDS